MPHGDEAFSREFGHPEVSARQRITSYAQLTRHPDRHGLLRSIKYTQPRVRDCTTDRNRALGLLDARDRCPHGGFGRTVQIPELDATIEQCTRQVVRQRLTTTQHTKSRDGRNPPRGDQHAPSGWRGLHHRHVGTQLRHEPFGIGDVRRVGHTDLRADGEWKQQFEQRDVERERGDCKQDVAVANAWLVAHGSEEIHQRA